MVLPAVLIAGSPTDSDLGDAVFEAGLTPVFRETILSAIAALHKERFLAIVIDSENASVDVLELILNIRDVDERTRIFVVSGKPEALAGMPRKSGVSVVNRQELTRKLTPTVVALAESGSGAYHTEDPSGQMRTGVDK